MGDPFRDQVALGPLIDAGQRDRVHGLVTASVEGGATVRTGGTYEGLFYRPTVLGDVSVDAPAYREEIFGPVAPVTPFSSLDEVGRARRRHGVRPVARASSPGTSTPGCSWPSGSRAGWCTSTTRR